MKRLIRGKERAVFAQVFEQITQMQVAMAGDKHVDRRQVLLRRSKASDGRPNTLTPCQPRSTVEAAPVVRRLGQSGLFDHRLGKAHVVEVPKARDKRQQQPESLTLINHQRLIAMTIVMNPFFRRPASELEW